MTVDRQLKAFDNVILNHTLTLSQSNSVITYQRLGLRQLSTTSPCSPWDKPSQPSHIIPSAAILVLYSKLQQAGGAALTFYSCDGSTEGEVGEVGGRGV